MKDTTLTITDSNLVFLSEGADERLQIDHEGITKYGIRLVDTAIVNRGSCTCNAASASDMALLQQLQKENSNTTAWVNLLEKNTKELKQHLQQDKDSQFEVFYGPSGTDLLYHTFLIALSLAPKRKILNIVTCIEELGSGTKMAAVGKLYAHQNQFGQAITIGSDLFNTKQLKTVFLDARSPNGEILNHKEAIVSLVEQHTNDTIIINLVYGSKSGIEDNLNWIDQIIHPNIIWNVDLCQFRHSRKIIHRLLQKGCLVMLTGSKFYQSPPFCGAMLVPTKIYSQILAADDLGVHQWGKVFSAYDLPLELRSKISLPDYINRSGIARWKIALKNIYQYDQLPTLAIADRAKSWRRVVTQLLEQKEIFELMPFQENSNQTIISFRVQLQGKFLDYDALKKLHRSIVLDDYSNTHSFKRIFIGQPVRYGKKSFLRLAIGSNNIRKFVLDQEEAFDIDRQIIQIIESKLLASYENNA